MKILSCHNFYQQPGGEDQSFSDEADLLESRGHEVIRYTLHNDDIKSMSHAAVAQRTVWSTQSRADVAALIRRQRPDVMHCHNTFPLMSPSIYYAARRQGVAVVQTLRNYRLMCLNGLLLRNGSPCEKCVGKAPVHGVVNGCYRESRSASAAVAAMLVTHRAIGTWRRVVDRFIALSSFARDKFIEAGFDADRMVVKPNFIAEDPRAGDGCGGFAVYAGRLSDEKGVQTLLGAWRALDRPMRLRIVGDGPLADMVRRAAATDNRIDWLERIPYEQVIDLIGDARCVIVPSHCYETFGRTIIEAFARATPAIVSDHGSVAGLVDHGRTGYRFTPADPDALAHHVRLVHDQPNKIAAMRAAARREYVDKFTADANYEQLMTIYHEILGDSAPAMRNKEAA